MLSWLGFNDNGLIYGSPQPERADDYQVATPLIRSVVTNGFGSVDNISPYKENFRSFVAAPIHDWALLFRPQFWGFLFLPPDNALSFYFFFFYASFIVGYTLLLRRLGVGPAVAVIVSLTLLTSQLPQVWWTQRAPVYAFAPWPMLAFLSGQIWYIRVAALAYATAAWLLGEFYPPTIIGNGFAWMIVILSFARQELALKNWLTRLAPAVLGGGIGVFLVWFYFSDLIPVMQQTIYPGARISGGGGIPWQMILAHLFPNFATLRYYPIILSSNTCEVGVVGTFIPLMIACFSDRPALFAWARRNKVSLAIWFGGLVLMTIWMVFPIPAIYGMPLLWHRSRVGALLWGYGLLMTVGLSVILSQVEFRISRLRLALFSAAVLLAWLVSKAILIEPGSEAADAVSGLFNRLNQGRYDLYVLPPLAILAACFAIRPDVMRSRLKAGLLLCGLLPLLWCFGRYNPVSSARVIMSKETTPILEATKELAAGNPHGWAAVRGQHGMVLNAFGIASIGQTLFHPELAFFRSLYPKMDDAEFNQIFNRYAGITLSYGARPTLPRSDIISLPIFDVGTPLALRLTSSSALPGCTSKATIDAIEETEPAGGRGRRFVVLGWAPFQGITTDQVLFVHLSGGTIISARAIRETRLDVGTALKSDSYDNAGFALELVADLPTPSDPFPRQSLSVASVQNERTCE